MATRGFANADFLGTAGKQTNAADQTVHADTGVLIGASTGRSKVFEVRAVMGGSVAIVWQIQRRNGANGANVSPSPYTVYTPAGQSVEVVIAMPIDPGERVRITNDGAITGTSAASIDAEVLF